MGISPMVWYNRTVHLGDYDVSFDGDLPGTKDVLFIIVQIPRARASALVEVKGQDDEGRPAQKIRLE